MHILELHVNYYAKVTQSKINTHNHHVFNLKAIYKTSLAATFLLLKK